MRILFLTAQLPEPPHAGGTLRTNGLMRSLHAAGHAIHILTFGDANQLRISRDVLDEFAASVTIVSPPRRHILHRLRDLVFTQMADMQRRYESPLYAARLTDLLQRETFDLIQIESLEMAPYLAVIKHAQPAVPVIYDAFNAEYDLQRTIYRTERSNPRRIIGALYSWVQWRRLTRFEREVCQSVAHVVAVSEADAELFAQLAPGSPVSVIPNGIHAERYATHDSSLDLGEHALVFTGSMSYRPNVDAALWFAENILEPVRAQVPDAKFFVVGSHPHARLDALREHADIQVTGWVPEVNPFLHAAAVYVVPMRMGSGTRLKVLQAMAAGQAVVATSMGAQGLHVTDGVELRIADTAEQFASAIVDLLKHPKQRQAMGERAAQHVRENYDWSVIAPRLLTVYEDVIASRSVTPAQA